MCFHPISLFKRPHYLDDFLTFARGSLPDPSRVAVIIDSPEVMEGKSLSEGRAHLMYESLMVHGKYHVYHVVCDDADIDNSLRKIPLDGRKIQLLIIGAHNVGGIQFGSTYLTVAGVAELTLKQLHPKATIVLDVCRGSQEMAPAFRRKMPEATVLASEAIHKGGLYVCRPPPEVEVYCHFYLVPPNLIDKEVVALTGSADVDERFAKLSDQMYSVVCRGGGVPGICEFFKEFSPQAVAFLIVSYIRENSKDLNDGMLMKYILEDAIFILKKDLDCFIPFLETLGDLATKGNALAEVLLYFANPETTDISDTNPWKYTAFGILQYKLYENSKYALECFSRATYSYARPYILEIAEKAKDPFAYFLQFMGTGLNYYLDKAATLGHPPAIAYKEKSNIVFLPPPPR